MKSGGFDQHPIPTPALNSSDSSNTVPFNRQPPLPLNRTLALSNAYEWFFILLGGLPLFLPLIFFIGERNLGANNPVQWYLWMHMTTSAPHVYLGYIRLQRKIKEGAISPLLGWPIFGLFMAILYASARDNSYLYLMTLVNVIQSFHYLRQVFGIHRLYSKDDSEMEKRLAYWAFHLAMPFFVLGRWHLLYIVWNGQPSDVIYPVAFPAFLMTSLGVLAIFGLGLGLFTEWRVAKRIGHWRAKTVANLGIYFAIHTYGFLIESHYQRGFMAITIFHAIQYLTLSWKMEGRRGWVGTLNGPMPAGIGLTLFWLLGIGLGYGVSSATLMLNSFHIYLGTAFLSAFSIHHYLIDALLWKRRAGA